MPVDKTTPYIVADDLANPVGLPNGKGHTPESPEAAAPAEIALGHGEAVKRLTGMMEAAPGSAPQLTPEGLIREIMKHASAGGGSGGPPSKTFLGHDAKGWGGWMLKYILAGTAAIFAWYTWVNNSIESRPTFDEASDIADKEIEKATAATRGLMTTHEDAVHRHTEDVIKAHTDQLQNLGDLQIEQTTILRGHGEDLKEIKQDLRYLSGRNRPRHDGD
jgi:hypothetical protein